MCSGSDIASFRRSDERDECALKGSRLEGHAPTYHAMITRARQFGLAMMASRMRVLWSALELPNNATIRHYDIAFRPIFELRFSNLEMCHSFPLCFCSDAREVSNTTFLISFFLYSRIICMPTGIQEDDCESRMIERLE